jgi:glutathione S-transferase
MIVHGSSLSPFVRKVMVFAAEKDLAVENKVAPPGPKTPEFLAMSPFGKIPAFEDGDYQLCDSSAIVHYLEAKHAEPALIPAEARARGRTVWFDEYADTIMFAAAAPIFFNRVVMKLMGKEGDLAAADKAEADALPPVLDYLESVLPASGFLVEDRLTLADISVASPFVNFRHASVAIDAAAYPKITNYVAGILARPSFATLIDKEVRFIRK